jgi:hypothetical protein
MKKGVLHFIFLLAILFTNSGYGQSIKLPNPTFGFNEVSHSLFAITQSDDFSSSQNLIEVADDDLTESQRKIILVQKSNLNSSTNFLYFIKLVRINKYFSKIYFFELRASLFLFIRSLRI